MTKREPEPIPSKFVPLTQSEANFLAAMAGVIEEMPRADMSDLQKQFLRLSHHATIQQYKVHNLAIHASNQERKADRLEKLVNEIDNCNDFRRVDELIKAYREKA